MIESLQLALEVDGDLREVLEGRAGIGRHGSETAECRGQRSWSE